ncbi:MAG: hypothetical protein V9G10_17020 [Candidatus Nanopelagicales bacterium]
MDASSADRLGRVLATARAAETFIARRTITRASSRSLMSTSATPGQPATGMLALDLIDVLGVELTADIATCLYAAISSDTGSFKYPATTPAAMRAGARLMETGIDFAGIARAMFDTRSQSYIALQAAVMQDLRMPTA